MLHRLRIDDLLLEGGALEHRLRLHRLLHLGQLEFRLRVLVATREPVRERHAREAGHRAVHRERRPRRAHKGGESDAQAGRDAVDETVAEAGHLRDIAAEEAEILLRDIRDDDER